MTNEHETQVSEQDLSEGALVDQEPLDVIEDPPIRLAGYNQIPDFGGDTEGTIQETKQKNSNE